MVWSEAVARNCVTLDEICIELGVPTLSSFGFTDDWSGKTMVWHDPQKGLETIEILAKRLRENSGLVAQSPEILADLQRMSARLQVARATRVRFCLILHGDGWNGMEIEQRCGYF